jgi:hypothetical protein
MEFWWLVSEETGSTVTPPLRTPKFPPISLLELGEGQSALTTIWISNYSPQVVFVRHNFSDS